MALASSNAAVKVPAAVTVPAGAKTSAFNANTTAVSSAQSVTLTASAGNVSKTFAFQLNGGNSALQMGSASVPGFIKVLSGGTLTLFGGVSGFGPTGIFVAGGGFPV